MNSAGDAVLKVSMDPSQSLILDRSIFASFQLTPFTDAPVSQVKEGDIVTMCSATFGDDMWSTRGVGLTRVLAAIRVRAGPKVKLVLESPKGYKKKQATTKAQLAAKEQAAQAAQKKKDELLSELEKDEKRLKKGKFFGLF